MIKDVSFDGFDIQLHPQPFLCPKPQCFIFGRFKWLFLGFLSVRHDEKKKIVEHNRI